MNRIRVLVVDDDTVVRRMIAKLLKDRGIETLLAGSGEEGIATLAGSPLPDAVVCDLYLPGISGLEVIEQIRAREEWRALPIVVLTGRARGTMMVRAEQLGDRIVTKPFSSVDLLQVIDDLLGQEGHAAA